ncbi:hypothetical protein [Solibaculum mannosilyticum]|uniref:hypothetical protein n=1 Tax=Solibaculum mannosilyticum TaxID=2780922 RepID=UPI0007A898B4|nr:hypothetical protein BN3661_00941 [Eubacteriaceae bacterium CHKCI005]
MMNTNLYTAVGKFHVKGSIGSMRCPLVTIGGREFILDMQEMMLWTVLNWRILTEDEIYLLYEKKVQETGFMSARSAEECVRRLVQRGLIAKGSGDTGADALYDLLSELYVIPISENLFLRMISFIRLTLFSRLPYSITKKIFSKDKRNDNEKKVMRLANRAILSTAEIIKCIDQNVLSFTTDEDLLNVLYHDEYTTSDNIAYAVRSLPQCRPVITSIANLYLRKQIIFERS